MALERLIADGRIHPARIEETVDKCRRELEIQMKREGDKAIMELGIHSLHPDLVKLIGRLKYRTSYGQNVLSHSLEVAWLAGLMAGELGVNVQLARRAGLLHDIGKALDHEIEGSHVRSASTSAKYRENPQIIHAIEAHHGDVEPKTTLAFIIMAADAISAARPVPAARTWRATSSVWKHWRLSATASRVSKAPTPPGWPRGAHPCSARQGQRRRGHSAGPQCRQKIENGWITPARSRSASSASRATEYAK